MKISSAQKRSQSVIFEFSHSLYPSDIGLVGITFKYGVIGLAVYLGLHASVWHRLWQANRSYREQHDRLNPLLWALLVFFTAQTFNLVLNPGLAFAQGIISASLAVALAEIYGKKNAPKE